MATTGGQEWPETRALPRTFFRAPLCPDLRELKADVAFLGVPFDQSTYGRPGARFGPDGIRDVDRVYDYTDPWEDKEAQGYFDIDRGPGVLLRGITMADCGNVTVLPADIEKNFGKVTTAVRRILERGAFPVVVGGDHAITYPVVRAFEGNAPLDIVHFDAHMDFTHDIQGVLYAHGSPIRRVSELPFVRNITSIGVRKARHDVYREALERGVRIITAEQLRSLGPERATAQVPPSQRLYVTLDIDVLDPTYAPGTGTPAAGGLSYFELRDALLEVTRRGQVVGFDLVEVAPPYDPSQITTRVAAQLIIDLLSVLFPSRE